MRVIAGSLKAREFAAPQGHKTHPMGDKIRGAAFNILGDITGLRVLDAYAGSGAVSFEAISRGAASAVAIEIDKGAHFTIQENIVKLGVEDTVQLIHAHCVSWATRHPNAMFDLVFCDPPYDRVLIRDIAKLGKHVNQGGVLILSWPEMLGIDEIDGFEVLKDRVYANARLVFYRKLG
jgi:16S rRNA (guanine966-N2)-methyltransferase